MNRRVLGLFCFLAILSIAIFSCAPTATYFTLTEEGIYDWTPGFGSSAGNQAETFLAYQHGGSFMLAKHSVSNGLQPLKKVIAVDQTEFTNAEGKTVPCLAFKQGANYDGPWEIVKCTGETVVAADRNLTLLPSKIIEQKDSLIFVR